MILTHIYQTKINNKLSKKHFIIEKTDYKKGTQSISIKKKEVMINFESPETYIDFENRQTLTKNNLIDLFIIKTKKYNYNNDLLNSYYEHILIFFYQDKIEVRSKNFEILYEKDIEDDKTIILANCEQFKKNVVNCFYTDSNDDIMSFPIFFKVTKIRNEQNYIFNELSIKVKPKFVGNIVPYLQKGYLFEGAKRIRNKNEFEFNPIKFSIFCSSKDNKTHFYLIFENSKSHFL